MTTLTLQRLISNRTCTIGKLTCEAIGMELYTLEAPLPKNGENYKHALLPPGEYTGYVSTEVFEFDGTMIETACLMLNEVQWFPRAGILPAVSNVPRSGLIFVSDDKVDDYNLDASRNAALAYLSFSLELGANGINEVTLRIIEDHDTMTFSNLTEADAKRIDLENEIIAHKERLLDEIDNYVLRTKQLITEE